LRLVYFMNEILPQPASPNPAINPFPADYIIAPDAIRYNRKQESLMKVLVFGATGMVGQAAVLECLRDPDVELVVSVGRTATRILDPKLREIMHANMADLSSIETQLAGFDACIYCLGVASTGMSEADYNHITYGFTLATGEALSHINPGMPFIYVSGSGTDSSERGAMMWARVKGRTENALLRLPLKAWMFRPGFIEPMDGIRSKTPRYRVFYFLLKPVLPFLRAAIPGKIVSTREIGRAMLSVARHGYPRRILETKDIRALVQASA
jgi:uncharacterized protein YbjT (DUF2867 family)